MTQESPVSDPPTITFLYLSCTESTLDLEIQQKVYKKYETQLEVFDHPIVTVLYLNPIKII